MTQVTTSIITYSFRIKDSQKRKVLEKMSGSVNFIWNFCNDTAIQALERSHWISKFELSNLTAGSSKLLGLHSQTLQAICEEYATRRKQFKKTKLNWRSRKKGALGWVPFKSSAIKIINEDCVKYFGHEFRFWKSREIEGKIKCGSFNEDSRGRWYVNLQVEVEETRRAGNKEIGLDLGLKTFATGSDGVKRKTGRWYRKYERRLAYAQRYKKKRLRKTIHAKIRNKRKDELHKLSDKLVKDHGLVVVGDVGGKKLAKTKMAKSALDAGWSDFRTMLKYKAVRRHGVFVVVNEHNTSRTCSSCEVIPTSAPRGVQGLGVREWVCSNCNTRHDRDVNAALNILRLGHQSLGSEVT